MYTESHPTDSTQQQQPTTHLEVVLREGGGPGAEGGDEVEQHHPRQDGRDRRHGLRSLQGQLRDGSLARQYLHGTKMMGSATLITVVLVATLHCGQSGLVTAAAGEGQGPASYAAATGS
jgi:hypothetical protein